MPRTPSSNHKKAAQQVQDEPGADQRFSNILKRALNTPPPRKKDAKATKKKGKV